MCFETFFASKFDVNQILEGGDDELDVLLVGFREDAQGVDNLFFKSAKFDAPKQNFSSNRPKIDQILRFFMKIMF